MPPAGDEPPVVVKAPVFGMTGKRGVLRRARGPGVLVLLVVFPRGEDSPAAVFQLREPTAKLVRGLCPPGRCQGASGSFSPSNMSLPGLLGGGCKPPAVQAVRASFVQPGAPAGQGSAPEGIPPRLLKRRNKGCVRGGLARLSGLRSGVVFIVDSRRTRQWLAGLARTIRNRGESRLTGIAEGCRCDGSRKAG